MIGMILCHLAVRSGLSILSGTRLDRGFGIVLILAAVVGAVLSCLGFQVLSVGPWAWLPAGGA